MVDAATRLDDLKVPPGINFIPLKTIAQDNMRFGSIANIGACFRWKDGHAYDVEITDYH